MEPQTPAYSELNRHWKSACRILLGEEVGGLSEYEEWLSGLNDKFFVRKSSATGKEVVFSNGAYCSGARIAGMDEISFGKKFEPLTLNEMKDIDALLGAVRERAHYCGNIVIGNSRFVEKSSSVSDSFYVYKSVKVSGSRNVACSQYMRLSENIFGTNEGGESKFCVRCVIVFRNVRCFELWMGGDCADCYYSYGLEGCKDCLFSFNLVGKSHAVGNTVLPKEKYAQVKGKLLSELCEKLKKDKRLPSLVEITAAARKDNAVAWSAINGHVGETKDARDMGRIEAGFSDAARVLFGRELAGLDDYAGWLKRDIGTPYLEKSALSGKTLCVADYPGITLLPMDRLATQDEALALGERVETGREAAEGLSLSNAHRHIGEIAYYPPERRIGTYRNLVECCWGADSSDCYRTVICAHCKACSYSAWPRNSENCYGCGVVYDSQFCIKCHDSVELKRCFEVDSSRRCSDSWFCHNAEGLENGLFCFSVKNLRYAVGNAEVGRERFLDAKKLVLDHVLSQLEKNRACGLSIFNLGCASKA